MSDKKQKTVFLIITTILFCFAAILHTFIRPAYDDFFYMTYINNGVAEYIQNTITHYTTINGRAFVHFILCPLLSFDMIPFKIWNMILITSFAFVTGILSQNKEKSYLPATASFMSLFWLIGISVLSDGALWGAGSFNYLFPTFLIILYYWAFSESLSGTANNLICILGFFTAATVEMTGILAIVTVVYCSLANLKDAKNKKTFVLLNCVSCITGYATLLLSPGVAIRLEQNDYLSTGIVERILSTFSLFCRRICSIEGLYAILIITFLLLSVYMIKQNKKLHFCLCMANIVLLTLISTNVIYDSILICLISIFAFIMLCTSALFFFQKGDRIIMFLMICIFISLGICMISPIMAYRMLFPTSIFLIVICARVLNLCNFSTKAFISLICILAILASCTMILHIHKFSISAKVVDENTRSANNYDQSGTLTITNLPDETYLRGAVPSPDSFGPSYLALNNIPEGTVLNAVEPKEMRLTNDDHLLDSTAIERNDIVYLPVRTIKEISDANVSWLLACAHVELNGKTYRFCEGAKAADRGLYFSSSIKLSHPVRLINGTTFISLTDFNSIFKTNLKVSE